MRATKGAIWLTEPGDGLRAVLRDAFPVSVRPAEAVHRIDVAARGTAFGGFIGAGQTCIAGTRLLVQRTVHDEFVERLVAQLASKTPGIEDPRQTTASGSHTFQATDILEQHQELRADPANGGVPVVLRHLLEADRLPEGQPHLVDEDGAIPRNSVSIRLDRTVSGGVHEDYDLVNYATRPVRLTIEIAILSDFAFDHRDAA